MRGTNISLFCFDRDIGLADVNLILVPQMLGRAEKAMEAGKWEESASFIAQAHLLFERGEASDKDRRLAEQLMIKLREAREASESRARGLEALTRGNVADKSPYN